MVNPCFPDAAHPFIVKWQACPGEDTLQREGKHSLPALSTVTTSNAATTDPTSLKTTMGSGAPLTAPCT